MNKQVFTFKRDSFRKNRGDYSRFLNIYCSHCGEFLLLYQKDGPGPLKRLYFDRICAPENVTKFQNSSVPDVPDLACNKCDRLIAIPGVYLEEKRTVYLLLSFAFIKKVGKGEYPPEVTRIKPLQVQN